MISVLQIKVEGRNSNYSFRQTKKTICCGEFRNIFFPQHADRRGEVPDLQQTQWNKTKLSSVFSVRTLNTQQSCTGGALHCLGCVDRLPAASGPAGHRKQEETRASQLTASHLTCCLHLILPPLWWYNPKLWLLYPFLPLFQKSNTFKWLAEQQPLAFCGTVWVAPFFSLPMTDAVSTPRQTVMSVRCVSVRVFQKTKWY